MREEQLLYTFEERISAAGQERRQVCVDLGAQLAALLPTLQLDAGRKRSRVTHQAQSHFISLWQNVTELVLGHLAPYCSSKRPQDTVHAGQRLAWQSGASYVQDDEWSILLLHLKSATLSLQSIYHNDFLAIVENLHWFAKKRSESGFEFLDWPSEQSQQSKCVIFKTWIWANVNWIFPVEVLINSRAMEQRFYEGDTLVLAFHARVFFCFGFFTSMSCFCLILQFKGLTKVFIVLLVEDNRFKIVTICLCYWITHSSRIELISGVKNLTFDSPSEVLAA